MLIKNEFESIDKSIYQLSSENLGNHPVSVCQKIYLEKREDQKGVSVTLPELERKKADLQADLEIRYFLGDLPDLAPFIPNSIKDLFQRVITGYLASTRINF